MPCTQGRPQAFASTRTLAGESRYFRSWYSSVWSACCAGIGRPTARQPDLPSALQLQPCRLSLITFRVLRSFGRERRESAFSTLRTLGLSSSPISRGTRSCSTGRAEHSRVTTFLDFRWLIPSRAHYSLEV